MTIWQFGKNFATSFPSQLLRFHDPHVLVVTPRRIPYTLHTRIQVAYFKESNAKPGPVYRVSSYFSRQSEKRFRN